MKQVTIAVGNRRLLKLAKFLERLPAERFFYGTWVGDGWKGKPDLSCGTTACALGWATTIPEFRELGLRLGALEDCWGERTFWVKLARKRIDDEDPFRSVVEACERVFGLNARDTAYLFTPGSDDGSSGLEREASAVEVADHIRAFVASRAK